MHLLRLLLCCSLWVSGQALAQAPAAPETAPVPPTREVALAPGTLVQVRKAELTLEGRFLRLEDSALVLETDSRQLSTVLLSDVQELSQDGNYALEGFLVGGVAGAILGGVAGDGIGRFGENSPETVRSSAITGGLVGAVLLGGLGALIGWPIQEWDTLYEREQGVLSVRPLLEKPRRGSRGEVGLMSGYARNVRSTGFPLNAGAGSNKHGLDGRLHVLIRW